MNDKCPYCGADTRPGDNFCLNCGNRLQPANAPASPQQAPPIIGDATLAAPDDWAAAVSGGSGSGTTPASDWANDARPVLSSNSSDPVAYRPEASSAPTAQATMDKVEEPARFVLRSESGEILQEYPLDKSEITIGRAPNSDILLSKDKLTSRRHATVRSDNGTYVLHDERSANGTFVNGQQLEDGTSHVLQDGDHIGIGEHELVFRLHGSPSTAVEDLPTVAVPFDAAAGDMTYRTRDDDMATVATADDFNTRSMEEPPQVEEQPEPAAPASEVVPYEIPHEEPVAPAVEEPAPFQQAAPAPVGPTSYTNVPAPSAAAPSAAASSSLPDDNEGISFNRFNALRQPSLPDLGGLMAALSTMDGQVSALQEQFNATQEALRNHTAELNQTTSQLRSGIRRVSERMDNTIADVARSREALAWAELIQLMEDVMNNPRDIEYVTKLARKARELNKVFQIHQNVLNTMAECNSLLRSMIGEDK